MGPVNGLHDIEGLLADAAANIVHLRPGFFFENLLWQIEAIKNWGRISLPISGSRRFPMIATRDIGRAAALRLTDPTWSGQSVQELHGPADLSFDEVAEIISNVVGRKVVYVKCSPREMRQMLLNNAMSENAADLILELYDAAETGRLKPTQPRSGQTTTNTTLADFVHEVLFPKIAAPVAI